jgi:maltooligosyltrehalose trehalohydrolase
MRFGVWCPNAREGVEVDVAGRRVRMEPTERGWFTATIDAPAVTDYAYRMDGGEPLPDPRSPWQPYGVHRASRTVDHASYPWRDSGWRAPALASGVVYELHVGTFSEKGTFEGVIDHLDHLVELGVTHVELMPVASFPGQRGWGYDGVALYAPHEAYGGPLGLKRLVDACHARGLAILLDVVYNHLGPSGNYLARFGPYFTSRHRTPWGDAVNLDGPDSDEVRRFFCDNALMWLRDYHLDGLRLDAVHAIVDTSALHLLEELALEVDALERELARPLVLIAESDLNDPRIVRPRPAGGYGLDAQWSDDFHHAIHVALTGERTGYYADFGGLAPVGTALTRAFVYTGQYAPSRRRRHGRSLEGLGGERFVVCLQNHDQIGNRARGERLGHLTSAGRLHVAAALLLTAPFVPMLFQGEEWAASPFQYFTDHDDRGLARAVVEGRRDEFAAFGWRADDVPDPQAPETFARSRLDWGEQARDVHRASLAWYAALLELRRRQSDLGVGDPRDVQVTVDEERGLLTVHRGACVVVANIGPDVQTVTLAAGGAWEVLLSSSSATHLMPAAVVVPAETAAVLRRHGGTT